jgi:hypothetical protein
MNDDKLPPDGRLTDEQWARIRAGLVVAAGDDSGRSRPWLVPVAAAAAVGVLVAGIAVAALSMSGDDEGTPVLSGGPDSTSASPTEPTETVTAFLEPGLKTRCDQEARAFLEDAARAGEVGYAVGNTYLYTAHRSSLICDDWATSDGGPPTVLAPHPLDGPVTKDLFLISQNYSTDPAGGAQYFSGGDLIDGVSSISYLFPTGDTVEATITDTMWSMVYLMDKPPARAWTTPVEVLVTMDDGSQQGFGLTDMDLCAQINHGC